MNRSLLKKYARLVARVGANVGGGDNVLINSSLEGVDLARLICEECYRLGARKVHVNYNDRTVSRLKMLNEDVETLTDIPSFVADMKNSFTDPDCVVIQILSDDPHLYDGVEPSKLAAYSKAADKAFKRYYDCAMTNKIRWTLCAVPCREWAKTVFPDDAPAVAERKLWGLIVKTMRLDERDAIAAWEAHCSDLISRSAEPALCGKYFCANMPTEEVFSLPDRNRVDGIVYASMPLVHDGNIVDKFWLKFERGRIVDFGAERGEEILRNVIETDEGSHYLGEVALVQYDSPIRALNTLFFDTLFDENAACHLAIGQAYPLIEGADRMTEEELAARGANSSNEHVDFMIGTRDLNIDGIKHDGSVVPVFRHGNFAF